jgi:mannosyltransferase
VAVHIDGIIFSLQRQGGISVYTQQLLHHLATQQAATVLTLEAPLAQQVEGFDGNQNFTVLRRDARPVERYLRCRIPETAEVFHSSYYRRPSRATIPTVVTVHDFIYERFSHGPRRWIHMVQKHAAIRAAQSIICISEATRADLEEWVGVRPDQQVHVIHNGVADTFRPLPTLMHSTRPYILYVGERGGYKNFSLIVEALTLLPEFALHCVGGGALRPEELEAMPHTVRDRVLHLGFVTDEALNEQYNGAACLAYPSSYEGFGIPVVEAMRAGCPVVCIDCKAVLEVGGPALTVAQAVEPQALAEAITKAYSPEHRRAVIAKGLTMAQRYSWQNTHSKTLQVYFELGLQPSRIGLYPR